MLILWNFANVTSILLLGCVLLLACMLLSSHRRKSDYPPGPWGWPVVGYLPSLGEKSYESLTALGGKYGDVFCIKLGTRNVLVLNSYAAIHQALVKKAVDFSSRPNLFLLDYLGLSKHGIIFLPHGATWKQHRTFALMSLRDFGFGKRSMEGKVSAVAEKLTNLILQTGGEAFDASKMIQATTANVIFSIVVGEPLDYNDNKLQNHLSLIEDGGSIELLSQLPNFIPVTKHIPSVKRQLNLELEMVNRGNEFYRDFISKHKATFDDSNIRDFVDAFLLEMKTMGGENDSTFTEKQLEQMIANLLAVGTETTASTLRWALLYVTLYPEVQRKVQQEIDTVVGCDNLPSLAHRELLPYTKAVIAEVLRIRPVVPLSVAHATQNATTLWGYNIPADTMVLPNMWAVMHDPEQYPDPDVFKPDRFLDDSGQFVKPATFIPFGVGRRVCLGEHLARMELFLFITNLMCHFTFKLPEGASPPSTKGSFGFTLTPPKFQICAVCRK